MTNRKVIAMETTERRAKLIELRAKGHTWQACADQLGYSSRSHACVDYGRALDQVKAELTLNIEQYRQAQYENLQALRTVACEIMERDHLIVQGGKIVRHDNPDDPEALGPPILDDGPRLAAIDRIAKIDAQIAALLGLNAPTKVEAEGKLTVEVVGVDPGALT